MTGPSFLHGLNSMAAANLVVSDTVAATKKIHMRHREMPWACSASLLNLLGLENANDALLRTYKMRQQ
jgi:hypothetical protein